MMSTNKNVLDPFEQHLKDSLDQYEVPYNSTDWNQMERSLNGGRTGWWMSGVGLSVLIVGTLAVGGAAWYALSTTPAVEMAAVSPEMSVPKPAQPTAGAVILDGTQTTAPGTDQVQPAVHAENDRPNVDPPASAQGSTRTNEVPAGTNTAAATPNKEKQTASYVPSSPATGASSPATGAPTPHGEGTFTASMTEGCQGTSVDFKVEHMPEDGIYLWNFGDGSFSNKANPEHTFTKPGNYQVTLSLSRPGAGTIQNRPSSDMIVIHEAPKAAFNILKQEYEGHLPSVHFENRSLAGAQYHWDFGDGQTSAIAHPDHIYKKKGVYNVELTTTNAIGCVDKIRKEVRIDKDYNLDAPASFSPNGDGSEETFIPEALRTLSMKFNLTIYSPSGTLVYETNESNKPWLGKLNNRGEVLPPGDYVWVVDVRESLHLGETYTGKVKLVP